MRIDLDECFWMIDAQTKKALFLNPAYETITGRSCESLRDSPTSYEDLIHPDDRTHVLTKLDEATRTGQCNEKFRIVCAQGAIRWVWVRGFPVRDASGRILRLVGTALEITAQKEAEEQVTANLELVKSAWAEAEALRKATLSLTQDLRMDFVMDALLKSLEDLVPYTCARVLIPEGGPHVLALGERNCPEAEKNSSRFPLAFMADESSFFHRVLTEQKSIPIPDKPGFEALALGRGPHAAHNLKVPTEFSPIALCLTAGALGDSVDSRRSEIHLLAETLSHLSEPIPPVHAVDDAPQKAQAFADIVTIPPDVFFGDLCI
jgi:PAS domain S-box-containing protein